MFRLSSKLAVLAVVASAFLANPALAVDTVAAKDAPDLTSVRAKIKTKDWPNAVAELQTLATTHQHADVYNLLGFSLRNIGDYTQARTFYAKALEFDPDHRGAHEYLGELYVKTGEMDKARAMLTRLEKLCPSGCEELDDLKKDIAEAAGTKPN
jgi:Flp pilus assembly protein TadD